MQLQESGEMYLETIYVLSKTKSHVRSLDVAEHMNFSKPSVSRAISILKSGGYVEVKTDGHLSLTDSGREVAEKIYARHDLIKNFLIKLGVDEETAAQDACRMEHVGSEKFFTNFVKFSEYIKNYGTKNPDFISKYKDLI